MQQTAEHSPVHISKNAIALVAVVLLFILLLIAVYLWYDLRLEEIQQALQQLPNS